MTQTWEKLLFAHWPISADLLKPHIPNELALDTYEGQAWIGVVPFSMSFRLKGTPFSVRFHELNVRTYVTFEDKPGVLFFSLDASDFGTVLGARLTYALPYYWAKMQSNSHDAVIHYRCKRHLGKPCFKGTYAPSNDVAYAKPGSLTHWLTERYCLYSLNYQGELCRAEVHHLPWPLQEATATLSDNTMIQLPGLSLPNVSPLLHYAHHIDVVVWPLKAVSSQPH